MRIGGLGKAPGCTAAAGATMAGTAAMAQGAAEGHARAFSTRDGVGPAPIPAVRRSDAPGIPTPPGALPPRAGD